KETLQLNDHDEVFAIGDINNVFENKQGYTAQKQGRIVARNIELLCRLKSKLKTYKPVSYTQLLIPMGRDLGVSYLNKIVLGSTFTSTIKGKGLFVKEHWKLYGQKRKLVKEG